MPLPFLDLWGVLPGRIGYLNWLWTGGTKVHRGPRTLIVLLGSSAVGKTTVARCLARRYGFTSIDTNAIKRGMGITHDQLSEHTKMESDREWYVEIDGYYKYGWRGAAASASLSAVLLAVEAMDQGAHAVIAGLQNAWLRSFHDWEEVVGRLVEPHRMFGVRLVADRYVRTERLRERSPGQWSWFGEVIPSGEDFLTVDTTNVSPADVADSIIKHSGLSGAFLGSQDPSHRTLRWPG